MMTIKFLDPADTLLDFEESLTSLLGVEKISKVKCNSFTGVEEINFILSIGGGVLISKISELIKSYILRNQSKKIKIGEIEIQGFSKKEIEEILSKYLKNE